MTTVLLISPHRWRPKCSPHALEHLSHHLSLAGYEPIVVDFNFGSAPMARVREVLKRYRPVLVGITLRNLDSAFVAANPVFFPLGVRRLIRDIRRVSDVPIVVGGCAFSAAPGPIFEYLGADYGVAGHDEGALINLLSGLRGGSPALGDVAGLVWRDGKTVVENPIAGNTSELPAIRRDFVDQCKSYRGGLGNHYSWGSVECTRGCNRKCVYCIEPKSKGTRLCFKPVGAIVEEVEALVSKGIDWIWLTDSEFNLDLDRSKGICRALVRRFEGKVRWGAYFSALPFDDELACLLVRSGCAAMGVDAGHGDSRMMRRLGKDFTFADVERTARSLKRAGLSSVKYSGVLCGEGETEASLRRGLRRLAGLGAIVELAVGVRVYPGTPFEKTVRGMGPLHENPCLFGKVRNNDSLLEPVYYLSESLIEDHVRIIKEETAGEGRFLMPPLVRVDDRRFGDWRGVKPGYSRRRSNDLLMVEDGSASDHSDAGYV